MITISLCMIVRDEEKTLGRCLNTVKDIVDEIIIVDTGSVDKTKEIAKKYTMDIFDFDWLDDFSAARNFSFLKATKEYILWLDADDILLEEDRKKLIRLKEELDKSIDVVFMKYNLGTDGNERPISTYYRERLLKRSQNYKWQDPVHEYINPIGKIIITDIAVTHKKEKKNSLRNLNIFEKTIKAGKKLSHRNYFYYARELKNNGRFKEAKEYYEKFLSQEGGLPSNYMDSCKDLSFIFASEGDRRGAIRALFRSFEFGTPRAEICCELGKQYKEHKDYNRAIFWYKVATLIKKPAKTMGAVIHDCYNYYPYIEMSFCYFKLGYIQEAIKYNEKAGQFKPDSKIVQNNIKYYDTLTKNVIEMLKSSHSKKVR